MNGELLLRERISRNWEQQAAAAKLKVSQPYLSLIEAGKRPVTQKLAQRAIRVFELPPTVLPLESKLEPQPTISANAIAAQLASFDYPKFSHLKNTRKKPKKVNPGAVLIAALQTNDLESRIVEALPWLIYTFSNMDWGQIFKTVKVCDAQNRLGFVLSLAGQLAAKAGNREKAALFKHLLSDLEKSRLVAEDSFRRESLTEPEKAWLKQNRPKDARHWRILSNLTADYLIL